jgi:hypothetical protein
MKHVLFSLLCFLTFQDTVHAYSMEELSKSVLLLRQQQQVFELKDGKQVEVWYRDTITNKFEPKLSGAAGTGFIIRYHGNDYIVTAQHVAQALLLPSAEVVMNISGGKSINLPFSWLSNQKITQGARWFHHPKADISIYPMVYPDSKNIDAIAIDESVFPKQPENIPLLTSAYILGFPRYQGVQDNLSPLAKKTQIASKITSVNAPDVPPELKYIFLDEALSQGYSGAPVFYFQQVPTGIAFGEKPVMTDGNIRLLGVQSSDLQDDTGGKLSLVVPIQYLWEILESDEFIKYEKSHKKK